MEQIVEPDGLEKLFDLYEDLQNIDREQLKLANQEAKAEIAIRVYGLIKPQLGKKENFIDFARYCKENYPYSMRAVRTNPFLMGYWFLKEYYNGLESDDATSDFLLFAKKHLILKNQTRLNICNVLLLSYLCGAKSKEIELIFKTGDLTKYYEFFRHYIALETMPDNELKTMPKSLVDNIEKLSNKDKPIAYFYRRLNKKRDKHSRWLGKV